MHVARTGGARKRLWASHRRRLVSGASAIAATVALGAAAAGVAGVGSTSSAAVHARTVRGAQPAGAVSPHPATGTPRLPVSTTSATDAIKHLVQCGATMYAAGEFTQVISNGSTLTRDNVFSFSATAPYKVTSWAPDVNGTVNSIALTSDCSHAFIGGSFSKVDGATADNIAYIRTSDGSLVSRWGHDANKQVQTLALTPNGHLLVGGQFTSINGSSADPYFTSLNPSTGANDGFLHLNISGHYHYCNSTGGRCNVIFPTQVANQQLSHRGTLDLAEGVFTSVGGHARQQIFMLNLAASRATVTAWTSPEFDGSKGNLPGGYPYQCYWDESYYLRDAAWSPNDSTIYTVETGYHPWNQPVRNFPRTGVCDAAVAWPATQASVKHLWINYTGCNSLYSVAADSAAVYVAGHPQWSENSDGCKSAGPGAIADRGMQGLDPTTGNLLESASGTPVYSMSRANAGDMLITRAGLWIGSTNRYGNSWCNNEADHTALCFLSYSP